MAYYFSPTPLLSLQGISRHQVLERVDLQVGAGELVALLGPAGAGKSTLLRIAAGTQRADTGRVLLQRRDITALSAPQRGFGWVDTQALRPDLSVAQQVALGLKELPRDERDERVHEQLGALGLAGHADASPALLSATQQLRVALARALAPGPRLLLLDEPLAALRGAEPGRLRRELRSICRSYDVGALMATQDPDEALAVADRVELIYRGCIEPAVAAVPGPAPRAAVAGAW